MAIVTGGTVAYEDGVKAIEDYAPAKKARCELSFLVEDGSDADAAAVAAMQRAASVVNGALGRAPVKVEPKAKAPVKLKADPKQKTKADLEEEMLESLGSKADTVKLSATVADVIEDEPVAEVTDAELQSAVQRKNGELKAPDLIRALIAGYNPDPTKQFTLREIPQAQRAEFIDKLAALKK